MGYMIKEKEGKLEVLEENMGKPVMIMDKPLVLERCDTRERAEQCVKEWEARDKLLELVEEFEDTEFRPFANQQLKDYGAILDESEIRGIIIDQLK